MKFENQLNTPYPLTSVDEAANTKEKILLTATVMFAQKGVDGVSVREIADKVEIRAASIYNHFESKENLWYAVLERIEKLYLLYFERLGTAIDQAVNFKGVLDCMFSELFQVVDIFTYYGFSLVQAEQIRDERAYRIYHEVFFKYSIDFIKEKFDRCIQKGWARQFDTGFIALIFMHHVLTGIMMRVHEKQGHELPYQINEMFRSTYQLIYEAGMING